jgi:hypothetical protein
MTTIKDIQIPCFSGFYESIWESSDVDDGFLQECENRGIILTDEWELDFKAYENDVAEAYVDIYESIVKRELNLSGFKLIFAEIVSPREYNFSTDRIFCNLEVENLSEFLAKLVELAVPIRDKLSEMIRRNHTSCDGFISFMDNVLDEWLCRLKTDAEDNAIYLSYFILYLTILHGGYKNGYDIDYEIYEFSEVYREHYYEPNTDAAREELKAIELKEEERRWDEKHQLKIPFEYEN